MIECGDNLKIMRSMDSQSIDLIATDPPFNTGLDFGAYQDSWEFNTARKAEYDELSIDVQVAVDATYRIHSESMAAFCCFLGVRLVEMHRILKSSGSIYLHCDQTANSYIRLMMDAVFGANNIRNELTWKRYGSVKKCSNRFSTNKDSIFFYVKSSDAYFEPLYGAYDEEYVDNIYKFDDKDGRGRYAKSPLNKPDDKGYRYTYKGYAPPARGWRCPLSTMQQYDRDNLLIWPAKKNGRLMKKRYLSTYKGKQFDDLWADVLNVHSSTAESTGYPTQKPIALYERIIKASCPENGWVLDPFAGSGTTLVAAQRLGRRAIGIDINPDTKRITEERLCGE